MPGACVGAPPAAAVAIPMCIASEDTRHPEGYVRSRVKLPNMFKVRVMVRVMVRVKVGVRGRGRVRVRNMASVLTTVTIIVLVLDTLTNAKEYCD